VYCSSKSCIAVEIDVNVKALIVLVDEIGVNVVEVEFGLNIAFCVFAVESGKI